MNTEQIAEAFNTSIFRGSRWHCVSVHPHTKLGSAFEMSAVISCKIEQRELLQSNAAHSPQAMLDLFRVVVLENELRLKQRLADLTKEFVALRDERNELKARLGALGVT